jgi:hypothetical protein
MSLGRILILAGVVLLIAGVLITFSERLPIRLGRLPGDFLWKGRNTTFYFPLATSLLLSLILTLVLWLVQRR